MQIIKTLHLKHQNFKCNTIKSGQLYFNSDIKLYATRKPTLKPHRIKVKKLSQGFHYFIHDIGLFSSVRNLRKLRRGKIIIKEAYNPQRLLPTPIKESTWPSQNSIFHYIFLNMYNKSLRKTSQHSVR